MQLFHLRYSSIPLVPHVWRRDLFLDYESPSIEEALVSDCVMMPLKNSVTALLYQLFATMYLRMKDNLVPLFSMVRVEVEKYISRYVAFNKFLFRLMAVHRKREMLVYGRDLFFWG
jgi:hypothetical protein